MLLERHSLLKIHTMPLDTNPKAGMITSIYGITQIRRLSSGVKITSMLSGIFDRIFFSTMDNRNTPAMTASTPPLPSRSIELRGFCSS